MKYFSLTVAIIAFNVTIFFAVTTILAFSEADISSVIISLVVSALAFSIFLKFAKEYKEGVEEVDI